MLFGANSVFVILLIKNSKDCIGICEFENVNTYMTLTEEFSTKFVAYGLIIQNRHERHNNKLMKMHTIYIIASNIVSAKC